MIKGVHRQMIEVTHTGSPYFERAFLVVRGGEMPEEGKLHTLAQKVVEQAGTYAGLRRQRWLYRLRLWGGAAACAAGGAAVMWMVERIVG